MLPRERMRTKGVGALSDSELLAIILGTGFRSSRDRQNALEISEKILVQFDSLYGVLKTPQFHLEKVKGVGCVKSARIEAIGEIVKRVHYHRPLLPVIKSAEDVFYHFKELTFLDREEIWIAVLDTRNRILKKSQLAIGDTNSCAISPREVLRLSVKYDGTRFLIVHNHPSGDPTPSEDDIRFTTAIYRASQLVGLEFLDHIVIGRNKDFFSFSREGFMPDGRADFGKKALAVGETKLNCFCRAIRI